MKYSINPFKWLLWICCKIKWRNSKWQLYYCPKPLSRKGLDKTKDQIRELYAAGFQDGYKACLEDNTDD